MTRINSTWRNLLLEHIDRPVPIQRKMETSRALAMGACIARGWVQEGHPKSKSKVRPELTYITDAGRSALAKELAAWADRLIAQEDRLLTLMNEAGEIAKAEDLRKPGKLVAVDRPLDAGDRKLLGDDVGGASAGLPLRSES